MKGRAASRVHKRRALLAAPHHARRARAVLYDRRPHSLRIFATSIFRDGARVGVAAGAAGGSSAGRDEPEGPCRLVARQQGGRRGVQREWTTRRTVAPEIAAPRRRGFAAMKKGLQACREARSWAGACGREHRHAEILTSSCVGPEAPAPGGGGKPADAELVYLA
eukprot:366398-Chlamydomonas_euryale.AAC.5